MMSNAHQNSHIPAHSVEEQPGSIAAIARALHPLRVPPRAPGWNHAELQEMLGDVPRAAAAVLMGLRDLPQPTVIFTLRNDGLRTHAGQVSFPGGRADAEDTDAVATALRESAEEIGLDPRDAQPLGFVDCLETISGYCVTPVVARIAPHARLSPHSDEVASMFEVPLAFLLDPANLREREFVVNGHPRRVYEYRDTDPLIWGATASILVNLLQRMRLM